MTAVALSAPASAPALTIELLDQMIGELADAEYACGEWTAADGIRYQVLVDRATAARDALRQAVLRELARTRGAES